MTKFGIIISIIIGLYDMHQLQVKILDLADRTNIASLTLREIGEKVGDPHPQKIKHHLDQLFKKSLLREYKGLVKRTSSVDDELFRMVPIMGSANCGKALAFASECVDSYLTLSRSLSDEYQVKPGTFCVRAIGNSMNKCNLRGKTINDGDYLLIDSTKKTIEECINKYVLSVISGMANIKKLVPDNVNCCLALISESSEHHPPILIDNRDLHEYYISGEVIGVVKKPTF